MCLEALCNPNLEREPDDRAVSNRMARLAGVSPEKAERLRLTETAVGTRYPRISAKPRGKCQS